MKFQILPSKEVKICGTAIPWRRKTFAFLVCFKDLIVYYLYVCRWFWSRYFDNGTMFWYRLYWTLSALGLAEESWFRPLYGICSETEHKVIYKLYLHVHIIKLYTRGFYQIQFKFFRNESHIYKAVSMTLSRQIFIYIICSDLPNWFVDGFD